MAQDTCCKVLCMLIRAGILILGLRERRFSDNSVLLLNKKVSLQSLSAIPGEQSGSSLGLALQWKIRAACSEPWCSMPTFRMMDMCLTPALMNIDLRKLMRDPGSSGPCVWNQLQPYLTLIDYWGFVWLAKHNKLLLDLVFNGSAVTWGQSCSVTASGCLLAPPSLLNAAQGDCQIHSFPNEMEKL